MSSRPQVRLDAEMSERLASTAAERGLTTSDVIREALEVYFDLERPEVDDDRVLEVLAEQAARGNVPAARELLRHRRWQVQSQELLEAQDGESRARSAFDELDARSIAYNDNNGVS